jgi:hypothetical protein
MYILVENFETFPRTYIKKLIAEAYDNSLKKVKDEKQILKGLTITKSISDKKRPGKKDVKKVTRKKSKR